MFCVRAELVSFSAFSAEGAALVQGVATLPQSSGALQGHTAPYHHQNTSSVDVYHNQHQGAAFLSNFLSPKGESDLKLIVLFGSKHFHSAFLVN